ncbi:cell division protein FtsQ/DivIB [Guyparkeria sp. 1SP6A2]|nr:cell division protein FtsQ/DivIB [Guyparkeria sp. 1SP6A2]
MPSRHTSQARPKGPSWRERLSAILATLRKVGRWGLHVGLWLAFVAALVLVSQRVWLKLQAPITEIEIVGSNRFVPAEDVETVMAPAIGKGVWTVDLEAYRSQLLANRWLTEARISRQWPDRLLVELSTHRPIARWHGDRLLSSAGAVFAPASQPPDLALPQLSGPPGSQWAVWERYLSLRPVLEDVGLVLAGVERSPRGALTLRMASGAEIRAGRDALETRLQRLLDVYPDTLEGRMGRVQSIDLRYSNGFAVAWREEPTAEASSRKEQ